MAFPRVNLEKHFFSIVGKLVGSVLKWRLISSQMSAYGFLPQTGAYGLFGGGVMVNCFLDGSRQKFNGGRLL